jgi:hypothetical protein
VQGSAALRPFVFAQVLLSFDWLEPEEPLCNPRRSGCTEAWWVVVEVVGKKILDKYDHRAMC